MTDELTHKLEAARRLIQLAAEAAEKEGGRLEVAYSGGKDSDLLLFLARQTLAGKESILQTIACNFYGEDVVNNVLFETDWETELKRIIGI